MNLFDLIKCIFKKGNAWDKISNIEKSRNFFMVNRIMSIQFPVQANQFNKLKINPYPVVDWWHRTMTGHYKSQPSWIFTKTNKTKENKGIDNKETVDFSFVEGVIREKYQITKRDLSDLKTFFPDRYNEWVSSIEDQIKTSYK